MQMKLKYYMRGLGIGIILTTIILSINNKTKDITDQEIINRAKKLGMVEAKTQDNKIEDMLDHIKNTTITPTTNPDQTKISISPNPTSSPTPTPETKMATVSPKPKKTVTPTKKAELNITISIIKGMSSDHVSKLLYEKGLVKDAEEFNQYLIKQGNASRIRVGEYTITKGTTYKEIMNQIISK